MQRLSLVLLGEQGSGKSTMGNFLLGDNIFMTGIGSGVMTKKTVTISGTLYGLPSGGYIDVSDSQGHGDGEGKDYENLI